MKEFMSITKAMSDENRIRSLMCLASGELCVCQMIEMLGLAPSTVSKHMALLHQAGLVEMRKDGRWIYYRLAGKGASDCVKEALAWLRSSLRDDPRIRNDARHLARVRKMNRDVLCAHYRS